MTRGKDASLEETQAAAEAVGSSPTMAPESDLGSSPTMASDSNIGSSPTIASGAGSMPTAVDLDAAPRRGAAGRLAKGTPIGRYMIVDVLGQGGMGVVYAAFDPQLDRKVAVKVLLQEAASEAATARLLREGRAIARLAHPNVVTVFDVGTHESSLFVAMELVDGTSLDRWLDKGRPWREVLDAFLQAGTGLVAAHDAGMIHRDFKPANVLIGKDGRVRVTDFGLARMDDGEQAAEVSASAPSNEDLRSSSLTRTGAIMGTPAYMSPEQFEGKVVDAKSDQFSFAVALYEGLYGKRPFPGSSIAQIQDRILANDVAAAPVGTTVPAWLRSVLLRALRANTEERYPTLAGMLVALRADPAAKRRRALLAGGAGATVLGLGGALFFVMRGATATPCQGVDSTIDRVWNAAKSAEIARAFGASKAPYAADALAGVMRTLDRYAADWRTMKVDVCKATQIRHEQTEEHQSLRTLCLEERAVEVRALTGMLVAADDNTIRNATQALDGLTPVSYCADLTALTQRVKPPADPAKRKVVDGLRERLATARAEGDTGKFDKAYTDAKQIAADAEPVGYKPILAEAQLVAGEYAERAGHAKEAEQLLTLATQSAAAGRDDATEATAWLDLVHVVGVGQERADEAQTLIGHAEATLERVGGDPLKHAQLEMYRGLVFSTAGKYEDARAAISKALETQRRLLPADSTDLAATLDSLGNALHSLGKYEEARTAHTEGLAIREKALGPNHPDVASSLMNLGSTQLDLGDFAAAEASYRRCVAIREKALGPDHPDLSKVLSNLGVLLRRQSKYPESIAMFQRSVDILEKSLGTHDVRIASPLHNMGATLMLQGKYTDAEKLLDRGLAIELEARGPDHPDLAAFYGTLTQVYEGEKRWADAFAANAKATAIDIKALGPEHPDVAADYSQLGELYQNQDQYDKALEVYQKVLAIHEKALGPDNPELAIEVSNMGTVYSHLKRFDESIQMFRRALALDEKGMGPNNSDLIYDLSGLGNVLYLTGKSDEAIPMFERALALPNAEVHQQSYFNCKYYLGKALYDAKQRDRGHTLVIEARDGFKKISDDSGLKAAESWLASHR